VDTGVAHHARRIAPAAGAVHSLEIPSIEKLLSQCRKKICCAAKSFLNMRKMISH
jgi:hypothetical protein